MPLEEAKENLKEIKKADMIRSTSVQNQPKFVIPPLSFEGIQPETSSSEEEEEYLEK